jgi:hypothetical protein
MPEFILDTSGKAYKPVSETSLEAVYWTDLDAFTQGYIEALFFTESSPAFDSDEWHSAKCRKAQEDGQADGTLPGDVGFSDLAPEALAEIIEDCRAFQEAFAADLAEAYAHEEVSYSEERAGHDYWLTRNGHGAGFWDRGLGAVGDRLSDGARYSSVDPCFGADGKVYLA